MKKRRTIFVAVFVAILLFGLATFVYTSWAFPRNPGTIEGTVGVGPICPIERIDIPCLPSSATYQAVTITVKSKSLPFLQKTTHSDGTGHFQIEVAPGTYTVDATQNKGQTVQISPSSVTVTSGQTVNVMISIDTGIR